MRKVFAIAIFLTLVTPIPEANARESVIKKDFRVMQELLAAMGSRGVICETYTKRIIAGVIEEGTCLFQGIEIQIDLWEKRSYAKAMEKALLNMPAVNKEYGIYPTSAKVYVFTSNNFNLLIDYKAEVPNSDAARLSKLLRKQLGIRYKIGK